MYLPSATRKKRATNILTGHPAQEILALRSSAITVSPLHLLKTCRALIISAYSLIHYTSILSPRILSSEQVQKFMEINNIKINEIVLNEYKKELLKTGRFKLSSPGDATLKIVINTYGFGNSDALSDNNKRKPLLNVKASLIQNNRIIWEKQEYVTNFSDLTTPYDMNDLAQKPDLLKKSFSQAANIVASQAFSQLLAN